MSNPNCLVQSCFENCCNRYGYCIDRYSFDYGSSSCYYYYGGYSGWAVGYIVLTIIGGLLIGLAILSVIYWCWRRSKRHHGMPYVENVNVHNPPNPPQENWQI